MRCIPATRNKHSQAQMGGALRPQGTAQVVSPVLAPVRRFVPTPQSRGGVRTHLAPVRRGVDPFVGRCERL